MLRGHRCGPRKLASVRSIASVAMPDRHQDPADDPVDQRSTLRPTHGRDQHDRADARSTDQRVGQVGALAEHRGRRPARTGRRRRSWPDRSAEDHAGRAPVERRPAPGRVGRSGWLIGLCAMVPLQRRCVGRAFSRDRLAVAHGALTSASTRSASASHSSSVRSRSALHGLELGVELGDLGVVGGVRGQLVVQLPPRARRACRPAARAGPAPSAAARVSAARHPGSPPAPARPGVAPARRPAGRPGPGTRRRRRAGGAAGRRRTCRTPCR